MRKITLLLAVLLGSLNVSAQTDVTKYFLTNYGFDDNFDYPASSSAAVTQEIKEIPGWTQEFSINYTISGVYEFGFKGTFNGGTVPAEGYDGESGGGLALSTGWAQDFPYSQNVTLPAGSYTIKVPTYNGITATAGKSLLKWIPSSGTTVSSSVSSYPTKKWTLDEISFTLTKTTKGKIQIGYNASVSAASSNCANLVIDYVQLLASDMAVDKTDLKSTLDSANGYYGDGTGSEAAALKAAIDASQAVYDDESADMVTVLESDYTLKNAIEAYRRANVSEENPLDCTDYITNPSFENGTAGWTNSNLAQQTNTSFTRKAGTTYLEKWVGSGSAGDASVRQTITIPNGKYKLTVAAQNYTQSSTTKKNTGAYIFAGDQQEPVYTPNNYTVSFTSIAGEVEIGFVAEGATGNWLAVDNFRLSLVGYVDDAELIAELSRLVDLSKELQGQQMSKAASAELQAQADAANLIIDGTNAYNAKVTLALQNAIAGARSSIANYQALQQMVASAAEIQSEMMTGTASENLQTQLTAANLILDATNEYDAKVVTALQKAISAAQTSVANYKALQTAIDAAEKVYDESKDGAADLLAELTKAKAMMTDTSVADNDVVNETEAVKTAQLLFLVANGSGTAPTVKTVTDFMIPAAHGGLIRATISGSNIRERGICWSTEKEPTIADHRETTYYTQKGTIFHVQEMQPASVYYARAYAISNTYAVGYGDVIKVVTLPKGSCVGTWDNGAPTEAANTRCRNAIQETMDYLNEWTAIKGFTLSGHYGAQTPTADCSYGGYMRIGPNAGNQAIGTVIHETGHGVGVGTHWRWNNCADTRENTTYGKWLGRWANETLHFLENTTSEATFMTGDAVHGWGTNASYDWFVNGADKDKHTAIQYIGGCALLYSLYVDGLCPTSGHPNGVPGYTFNFDDDQEYVIMSEDADRGLNTGFVYQRNNTSLAWKNVEDQEALTDSVKWKLEYVPSIGYYRLVNAATGRYISHSTTGSITMKNTTTPSNTENFQFMPGRKDIKVTINGTSMNLPSYWFCWYDSSNKAMELKVHNDRTGYGNAGSVDFNYSDKNGTKQRYIIIPAETVKNLLPEGHLKGDVNEDGKVDINDVVAVINQMAGTASWRYANVNEDAEGMVDINDVVAIINIMAAQ